MNQESKFPSFLSFRHFIFEIYGYVNDAVEKILNIAERHVSLAWL